MSHDNHMRDLSPYEINLMRSMIAYPSATEYQPKHAKNTYDDSGHCCYSGCSPMACPGQCCAYMGYHKNSCSYSIYQQMLDNRVDLYIESGRCRHLERGT